MDFRHIYFAVIMGFYGVTFWLPQIVKAFSGKGAFAVGLSQPCHGRRNDRNGCMSRNSDAPESVDGT